MDGLYALPRPTPRTLHRVLDFVHHEFEPVIVELGAVRMFHIDDVSERIAAPTFGQCGTAWEWLGEHCGTSFPARIMSSNEAPGLSLYFRNFYASRSVIAETPQCFSATRLALPQSEPIHPPERAKFSTELIATTLVAFRPSKAVFVPA
jgi:hypothetical protein